MSTFADTSALYAILVASEEQHAETVREFRLLVKERRPLWTTSYVVVETMALLQHRLGLPAARDFEEHIYPLLSVEWVSEGLHRKSVARLQRENRRRLSLVDCVSFEFMKASEIREVLGLDDHFEDTGFHLLPHRGKKR